MALPLRGCFLAFRLLDTLSLSPYRGRMIRDRVVNRRTFLGATAFSLLVSPTPAENVRLPVASETRHERSLYRFHQASTTGQSQGVHREAMQES